MVEKGTGPQTSQCIKAKATEGTLLCIGNGKRLCLANGHTWQCLCDYHHYRHWRDQIYNL